MSSYKFRILIDTEDEEEIFRDISISSWDNFENFYKAIVEAFGFRGDQLASFYVSNEKWDKGHEIALMDMGVGSNLDAPSIMKETTLSDLIAVKDQKFLLVYDFLKMWCFMIELIETNEEILELPRIDLSVGIAPSEDSKEIDLENSDMGAGPGMPADLGNDIDDIFSEFEKDDDDKDDGPDFDNIDDLDI